MKHVNAMEGVYDPRRLHRAWQQVKSNAGAAGIDAMSVDDFDRRQEHLLDLIHEKLEAGTYRFKLARRALIPKDGSAGMRKLGIPVVMDRVVGQSVNLELQDLFEPDFTPSNFGFRRHHSQHQAIRHVQDMVAQGHEWCASIDLKSFFDEIPHQLIFKLIRRKVSDERLLTLIARALKAGVLVDSRVEKSDKGCPQGSPLSPILSNIVLTQVRQKFCRQADFGAKSAWSGLITIRKHYNPSFGMPM